MKIHLVLGQLILIVLCTEVIATDDICSLTTCACCKSTKCIVAGGTACDGCREGFTTDTCRDRCPDSCFNCSQNFFPHNRTCYACKPGYYNGRWGDNMEMPLLKDCSLKCPSGCKICDSHYNCKQCNSSHFMSSRKICEQCQENCEICSSATFCIKCKYQYFKSGDGVCTLCIPHCKTCSSYVDCQECKQGFYLNENRCQICQEGCISCNNIRICNKCEIGYHQFDSKCFHFPELPCTDNKTSIVCKEECLNSCLDRVCNDSEGSCTVGCLSGYWGGNTCNQTCVRFCKETVCKFSDGKCNAHFEAQAGRIGWVIGLIIACVFAIIVVLVFTCYLKRRKLRRSNNRSTDQSDNGDEVITLSKPTDAVNSMDKNETESLLLAGNVRIENDGIPCNCSCGADEPKSAKDDVCFICVPSYKKSCQYIVSYGSKISLNNESFWKKIWESQCEKVVMLSTSPESEEFHNRFAFGSDQEPITVRFSAGRAYANYTVIPFTIEQDTLETFKETNVVLFEFFADIQDNVERFLEFHKMVNVNKQFNRPTLVHCSAGVQRCVTYLAVDMLQTNARTISKTDIRLCLLHLNKHALETTQEQIDNISKLLAQHLQIY